jgi:hypothetical protein
VSVTCALKRNKARTVNQLCLPLFVGDSFCRWERPVTREQKWFGYGVLGLNLEVV